MKKSRQIITSFIAFLGMFLLSFNVKAQNVALDIQGNKNEVKLIWFVKDWPVGRDGFVVKRKTNSSSWKELSGKVIPGVEGVDLTTRTNDPVLVKTLESKRTQMISESTGSTSSSEFNAFLSNEKSIKLLPLLTNFDYNKALVYGFAYYDKAVPSTSSTYTYGLFEIVNGQVNSTPVATASWEYGSTPKKLNYDVSAQKVKLKKTKGVQLTWPLSKDQVLKDKVRDFVIYKEDTLGNVTRYREDPRAINMSNDPVEVIFVTTDYQFKEKAKFIIKLRDYFDTERFELSVKVTPADFPVFPLPTLKVSHKSERDQNTLIEWSFPEKYTSYIKTVEVKKGFSPEDVETIELNANQRTYNDASNTKDGGYHYLLKIVTTTGDVLFSEPQHIYKYFPPIPPKPSGISGEYKKGYALLSWNRPKSDDITVGFQVYRTIVGDKKELVWVSNLGTIDTNAVHIKLGSSYGGVYKFAIKGVSKESFRSEYSDTVEVFVPSKRIPFIQFLPFDANTKNKNKVTLTWKYPDYINDLAGFRIYKDGVLVADESKIDASKREWLIENLAIKKFGFEIQAVTTSGVLSKKSQLRYITIKEQF